MTKKIDQRSATNDFDKLADAIMMLKLCVHCGHQFNIDKENRAICPKCGRR